MSISPFDFDNEPVEQPSAVEPLPQRGWLLILASVTVIAACLSAISLAIALFRMAEDPCMVICGAIILPLPTYLCYVQYQGTFRSNASAASQSGVLVFLFGLFCFYLWMCVPPHIALAAVVVGCGVAAWQNFQWYARLHDALQLGVVKPDSRISLRELMAATAAIAFMAAMMSYIMGPAQPKREMGEHLSSSDVSFGLPSGATDISFCQMDAGPLAYECTVSEQAFKDWADACIGTRADSVKLKPIEAKQVIRRYSTLAPDVSKSQAAFINDGWYFQMYEGNKTIEAAFDKTTGRAYYFEQ